MRARVVKARIVSGVIWHRRCPDERRVDAVAHGSSLWHRRAGRRLLASAAAPALSARAYDRVRKVARTIADLEGADAIAADHIGEACSFAWDDAKSVAGPVFV